SCHVGSAKYDVNHDLIAAGHPRLRFELGAYLANYPKHWSDARDRGNWRDFEARVWLIGQAVSAQAAARLLADRAAPPEKPWPEFAEYDCAACHHDLKSPSWRQEAGYAGRKAGQLPWGAWYFSLPRALARQADVPLDAPLGELDALMVQPYPDAARVRAAAGRADAALAQWRQQLAVTPRDGASAGALLRGLAGVPEDRLTA